MASKHLRLTRVQQTLLDRLIKSMREDLEAARSQPNRKDQVDYLKRLRKVLFELRKLYHAKSKHFPSVMGFETLEQLGTMFSLVKTAELSGDPRLRTQTLQIVTSREASLAQMEAQLSKEHKLAGIKNAQVMLLWQTELMLAHLDRWIALDKNKGGRPGKTERDFVIGRLAEACIDITGRKPSQSKSGALVNLSAQVLEIMFGHSNGVETAVQRVMASGKRQGLFLRKTKSSKPT